MSVNGVRASPYRAKPIFVLGLKQPLQLEFDTFAADVTPRPIALARRLQVFQELARRARNVCAQVSNIALQWTRARERAYLQTG